MAQVSIYELSRRADLALPRRRARRNRSDLNFRRYRAHFSERLRCGTEVGHYSLVGPGYDFEIFAFPLQRG